MAMISRRQLAEEQAKLLADLALETGLDLKRPKKPTADYASARGVPIAGPRSGIHRAVAGAGAATAADRSRRDHTASGNEVLNRTGNRCYLCSERVTIFDFHLDHVIPLSRGGTDDPANLLAACGACNLRKGTRYVAFNVSTRKAVFVD